VRQVWISAIKDLRRIRRDPVALAVWAGIPIFVAALLLSVFSRSGPAPHGRLLVADEDSTFLSSLAATAFSQGELGKIFTVEKVTQQEGRKAVGSGEASALLVIPKGFTRAFFDSQPSQLLLITNPSQRIIPGIAEETTSILLEAGFYLQSLLGPELRVFAAGPPGGQPTFPDQTVAQLSVTFNRLASKIRSYLDPRLIDLKTEVLEPEAPSSSGITLGFFSGMLIMAVFFVGAGLSFDFWKEKASGVLRRLYSSPSGLAGYLAGKLVAVSIILFGLALVSAAAAPLFAELSTASLVGAVLWVTVSGVFLYLLMGLVALHASSARAASLLGNLIMLPLAMLGGCFFPFEYMPKTLAAIGRWTPNGFVLVELRKILSGQVDWPHLAGALAVLLAAMVLAFGLSLWRLRRAFVS